MTLHTQLRWGGWLVIAAAVLVNGPNILVYAGRHTAALQAVYFAGFTALALAVTVVHLAHAHRAGVLGTVAYVLTVLSVVYASVEAFLTLASLSGIPEAHEASLGPWNTLPLSRLAVIGQVLGLALLGLAVARAGVLPRRAGLLVAVGGALQLPSQFAIETTGPLFVMFTVSGSVILATGLIWIGWALWRGAAPPDVQLSPLDRTWGAPVVIAAGLLYSVDAVANMVGGLSLFSSVTHLLSHTSILFALVVLHARQAHRAGPAGLAGFLLLYLGTALYLISATLITAQLAGAVETNRALMASWEDIPVGRVGSYATLLGWLLLGLGVLRAGVFPRWTGWLILVGLALLVPFLFTIQAYFLGIFWIIGALLISLGLLAMGHALWSRPLLAASAPS